MSHDSFKEYRLRLEEKRSSIVRSANAVHIDYYSPLLDKTELKEFDEALKKVGLQISSFDKTGVMYASLEDYSNLARVLLNHEITQAILLGAAGNFFWETIKDVTKRAWHRLKGRSTIQHTDTNSKSKELTFGIDFIVDANTSIVFRLDAGLAEEDVARVLDEAIEQVRKVKTNAIYKHPLFARYDLNARCWVVLDPMEEIRRIHFAKKASKKRPQAKTKTAKVKRSQNKKR